MTKFEIGFICFIIGFMVRPYFDIIIKILKNAWVKYLKQKENSEK